MVGTTAFIAGGTICGIGIGRPALGIDEAITCVLTRWPWPQLSDAIHGQEAPLGPYYLAMREWLRLDTAEWWLRLPSAVAMAAAIGVLTWWVARQVSTAAGAVTAAVILAWPSITRFGQEGRPYGATVLLAVLCSIMWWQLLAHPSWWSRVGYAVSVYALGASQALALSVVAAQVIATGSPAVRRYPHAVRATVTSAAVGIMALVPFLALVQAHALGNLTQTTPTPQRVWSVLATAFSTEPHDASTDRLAVIVLGLAVIGTVRLRDRQTSALLGYCWSWALVPPALFAAAALFRPTLVPRYLLVTLPAWAILTGQGCLVLGAGALALAQRISARGAALRPQPDAVANRVKSRTPRWQTVVAAVAATAPLAALIAAGLPHQERFRGPGGHPGGDVRPAVALLNSPGYRELPVVVLPDAWFGVQAMAYDPGLQRRTIFTDGLRVDENGHLVLRNLPLSQVSPDTVTSAGLVALMPLSDPKTIRDVALPWAQRTNLTLGTITTIGRWTLVQFSSSAH